MGIISTALCLWLSFSANNARASVTNGWDPTGLTVTATPTGSWEGATSWAQTAAATNSPSAFTEGAFAVFSSGTSGTGTFTVTANANHTVAGIYDGGLTGISAGTLTISGTGTLTFASGLQGIGSTGQITIANPIAGIDSSTGVQFNGGGGQVFMNGNNSYAGGTFFVNTTLVNFNNNNSFGTGTINFNTGSSGGAVIAEGTSPITISNAINIGATNATFSYNFVGNANGVTYSGPVNLHTNVLTAGSGGATNNIDIFSGVISSTSATGAFQRQSQTTAGIVKLTGANTYTGKSAFQSGITYVTTLNSVANPPQQASSSLGVPSSVATGTLSISATTFQGTLVYAGPGETTDRVIDLAGTTNNAILENDGTGALTFTSANTASGVGRKVFILAGSYAGAPNNINGPIVDSSSGATLLTKSGPGTWSLNGTNTFTGSMFITNSGTLEIGGNGKLASGSYSSNLTNVGIFLWNSTAAQTMSGVISGSGNVIDTGSGTLSLSGVSTLTGNVSVGSGSTIAMTGAGSLGSTYSHNITNNGTFTWGSSASATLSGLLTGSGTWNMGGSGTLTLTGNSDNYTGPINVTSGLLAFNNDTNLGAIPPSFTANAITLNGGPNSGLRAASNSSLNANRGITLGANGGEFQVASADTCVYNGVISGSGTFQDGQNASTGLGVLVLTGVNTYTNTTTIACGTLRLGASGSIASSSAIIMSNATTFDVSSNSSYSLGSATFTGIGGATTTTTIQGASGGTVNFGSQPITLSFVPALATGDPTNAALTISQGTLVLNGNTFNVTNASALNLGVGNYTLIQQASGNVNATGPFTVNMFGTALAPNTSASIAAIGGSVVLQVLPTGANTSAYMTNITASQSASYGTANATVSGTVMQLPGPVYPTNGATVNITVAGVVTNTTINDNTGDFSLTAPINTIPAGSYLITYSSPADATVPIGAATDTSTLLTITRAPLTVTATAQSKTYGGTIATGAGNANFTSVGLQNGEIIGSVTLAVSGTGAATNGPVSGSPYTITPSAATGGTFNANNYTITYATNLLTVNPAPLTVTGNNASALYGAALPTFGVTYTGFVNAQTLGTSDVGGSPSLVTAATNGSPIGVYDITNSVGTLTSTNYSFASFVDGTLTINPLPINLTGTRPYDGTNDADSSILTITTNYDGTNLTLSGSAVLTNSAAGTEAISDFSGLVLGGTAATNYTTTNATGSVIVTTLPLTITADAQSKNYGVALSLGNTAFTVGSGLFGSETVTAVTLTSPGTPANASVSGSPYVITPSAATGINGFLAANYNITYVTNSLTVSAVPLSITATPQSKSYGQNVAFASGSVAFTSSGLSNSETIGSVTLSCAGGVSNAPVSGSPYAITPSAATGGTFNPGNYLISYNGGLLTVNPALLTVTANDASVPYGTTNTTLTVTYSNFVNGEVLGTSDVGGSPSLSSAGLATNSPIGTYAISNSIGTLTSTNYTFNLVNGTLTVTQLAVNLTGTRPYDGTNDADSSILTIANDLDGANLTLSGSALLAGSAAGSEAISDFSGLALGGTASTNYTLTGASGSVNVTTVPLSITSYSTNKTYGTAITLDPTAFTVGGTLVGSETVTSVTQTSGGAAAGAGVGGSPYAITPSAALGANGFLAANYNIAYNNGALTVDPLTAVLSGARPYDGTASATFGILTVANVVGSDDVNLASGGGTLASSAVGTNAIVSVGSLVLGGTTAPDYTLVGATGSVVVSNPHTPFTITSSAFDHVGTNIVIVYQTVPGVVYQVLSSPVVTAPLNTWTNEGSTVTATDVLTTNVIPASTTGTKTYIVKDVQ